MIDLAFPFLQMVWAVTAGVLLVSSVMMIRAALTLGTIRGATSALLSISVMVAALVLVAQSAGLIQFILPSLGPVLYAELTAILVPVGLTILAFILVAKSKGYRKFKSQEPYKRVPKPGNLSHPIIVTLALASFLMLSFSFFMPWITAGSTSFTPSDFYLIILGEHTIQRSFWQQLLSQLRPASKLADSFVAVGLVLALFPTCLLFTLVSMLPRKTTAILAAAILPIAASFLALYSSVSIAWHLFGPTSLSVSEMRLASGPSIAILSGGLLFLAHSVSVRTLAMGGTGIEIPQHEMIPSENTTAQGMPLHAKEEKKRCPHCGTEVPLESLICAKCGMPAIYRE